MPSVKLLVFLTMPPPSPLSDASLAARLAGETAEQKRERQRLRGMESGYLLSFKAAVVTQGGLPPAIRMLQQPLRNVQR